MKSLQQQMVIENDKAKRVQIQLRLNKVSKQFQAAELVLHQP